MIATGAGVFPGGQLGTRTLQIALYAPVAGEGKIRAMRTFFAGLAFAALVSAQTPAQTSAQTSESSSGARCRSRGTCMDDEEYRTPIVDLIAFGKKLFDANWTWEEGAGRPMSKGNGLPLADPSQPLSGEARVQSRVRAGREFVHRLPQCARTASRAAAAIW